MGDEGAERVAVGARDGTRAVQRMNIEVRSAMKRPDGKLMASIELDHRLDCSVEVHGHFEGCPSSLPSSIPETMRLDDSRTACIHWSILTAGEPEEQPRVQGSCMREAERKPEVAERVCWSHKVEGPYLDGDSKGLGPRRGLPDPGGSQKRSLVLCTLDQYSHGDR